MAERACGSRKRWAEIHLISNAFKLIQTKGARLSWKCFFQIIFWNPGKGKVGWLKRGFFICTKKACKHNISRFCWLVFQLDEFLYLKTLSFEGAVEEIGSIPNGISTDK